MQGESVTPTTELGSFVRLYIVENGGAYHVMEDHWDEIDAAYHNWIERKIDRVLSLVGNNGSDILLAASRISEVCRMTPECRQRARELEAAEKAESGFAE